MTPSSCSAAHSDARSVLYQQGGVEPTAARLLQDVLDRAKLSPGPSWLATSPISAPAQAAQDGAEPSFLTALLGHKLERTARTTVQQHRWAAELELLCKVDAPGHPRGAGSANAHPVPLEPVFGFSCVATASGTSNALCCIR